MSYKKEDKNCIIPYIKLIIFEQNKLYRKIKKIIDQDMILDAVNTEKIIENENQNKNSIINNNNKNTTSLKNINNQNTKTITDILEKILSNTEKAKRYSFESRNISKKNQILLCKIYKTLSKIKCLN